MNYLAIDTCTNNLTLVLSVEGKLYTVHDTECGAKHSVTLMPCVEKLLQQANTDLSKMDFIACVVGAGSFTGIRIGVSTVKALCFAYNKPCLSVTSFDTLAYNEKTGKVLAVIDAKHDGYYVCGYQDQKEILPPSYVNGKDLNQLEKEYLLVASQNIDGRNVKIVSLLQGLITATEQKQKEITNDLDSLIPLYVRKSQAEEGR